jgi:hypothetical protein
MGLTTLGVIHTGISLIAVVTGYWALTRLPQGSPIAASPNSPIVLGLVGAFFVVYLIGLAFQLRWLRTTLPR